MKASVIVGGVAAVLLVAIALALSHSNHAHHSALEVQIGGGDAGGWPLAQPRDEHFDVVALERARADPAAAGLVAWAVVRHGHLVAEHYGHGMGRDSSIDFGSAAQSLAALLAGAEVQEHALTAEQLGEFDANSWKTMIERSTQQPYAQLLARQVWSRLNAAPAWIELPAVGAAVPADCCLHARLQDWLRVGALLTDRGNFEGSQVVPTAWVDRMLAQGDGVQLSHSAQGMAPFAADDMAFLRGPGRWRLWLSPSLHLVILFGSRAGASAEGTSRVGTTGTAAHEGWDETRLPNLVIEALADRPASQRTDSLLHQLVPNH